MIIQVERFKAEKFLTIRGKDIFGKECVIRITWDDAVRFLSVLTAMLRGKLVTWRLEDGEQKCEVEPGCI